MTPTSTRVARIALVGCALVLGAVTGVRLLSSWDVWWHLAIGREAVTGGSTVPVDTFSYSFAGASYVHKDLIADVLFYAAFEQLGHLGIGLIRALAIPIATVGLWFAAPRAHRDALAVAVATCVFAVAVQDRLIPRPLVFTVAFFPLALGLIERVRRVLDRGPMQTLRAAWPLVLLQFVWMNLHRGGMLGIVLLAGLVGAAGLAWGLARVPRLAPVAGRAPSLATVAALAGIAVAAVLAGACNASGFDIYTSGLSVSHDAIHRGRISEWLPLTPTLAWQVWPVGSLLVISAWGLVIGRLVQAVRTGAAGPLDVWHLGVLALFTWQGIASMRWLSYASGIAAVVVVLDLTSRLRAHEVVRDRAAAWIVALTVTASALAVSISAQPTGVGVEPNRYPSSAMAWAHDNELGPNVHNAFVYGGYVTWAGAPRFRTLIDGRNDMVFPSTFFLSCVEAQSDIRAFAELWFETGGDWVLADNTPGRETFTFLAGHPDWWMVYWSEAAVIYVPRAAYPQLAPDALHFVRPGAEAPALQDALRRVAADPAAANALRDEIFGLADANPGSVRAHVLAFMVATFDGPAGDLVRRRHWRALLDLAPDHPAVQQIREAGLAP